MSNIRVLHSEEAIAKRIEEVAAQINKDYEGREITVVGVLKGSFIFLSDLVRKLKGPVRVEFLSCSSYGDEKKSSGEVKLNLDISLPLEERDILIVEDIVDSGLTIKFLKELLAVRNPNSVRVCTLLSKPECRTVDVVVDYTGFEIANEFVIGYGLDYAQHYRELPFIGVLQE